jgi:hypothetical protein
MWKKVFIIFVIIIMSVSLAFAAPRGKRSKRSSFWGGIKSKLHSVTPKKRTSVTTAVGGVRGAKEDVGILYWKEKEGPIEVEFEELDLFNEALDLAVDGEDEASIEAFNKFLEEYPDSPLRQDALGAIRNLEQAAIEPAEAEAEIMDATPSDAAETEPVMEAPAEVEPMAAEPAAEPEAAPQDAQ